MRRWLKGLLSYGVAAAGLYWALHDVHFSQLLHSVAAINWWWVTLAVALQLLTYFWVGWEWQLLLRPLGKISLPRVTQAVLAGRFANDVLPVQLGYLVRAYLVARWMGLGLTTVVPSLLVERLWDGLWLAMGIGVTTLFVPLPKGLLRARDILGGVIFVGAGLVLFFVLRPVPPEKTAPNQAVSRNKIVGRAAQFLAKISNGIHQIGRARLLPALFALSISKLLLQALSYYAVMRAYGLELSIWVGLAAFLIAYLGICVPSTPASAGMFQLCSIVGLRSFGVEKTTAAGFSLVAFIVLTAPLSVVGFFALAQSGMSLKQIRKEVGR